MKWLKRITLIIIFLAVDVIAFRVPQGFFQVSSDPAMWAARPSPLAPIIGVVSIFFADVLVLWMLSRIGGPLKADVKASIKKFGGSIWITGGGLLGAFLAIAILAFGGVYMLAKLFS
jgi:hypothetical protein